jgi:hypothetical protein
MDTATLGAALFGVSRAMRSQVDGAITTGITPEPAAWTTPATSSAVGNSKSRGSLLSRAWRLAARPAARPKAAGCATC